MENKAAKEYLNKPYARVLIPDPTGGYTAEILEFAGCFAEGETAEEAVVNLEAAAESWIEASLSQNHEIPEPFSSPGYSGKVALRLPRSLHRKAVQLAERDQTSLNQFIVTALAYRVGADDLHSRIAEKMNRFQPMQFLTQVFFPLPKLKLSVERDVVGNASDIPWVQFDKMVVANATNLLAPIPGSHDVRS